MSTDRWYKEQPEWGTPESTARARAMTPGQELDEKGKGLWANIHAKRKRGEKPNPPGHPDRPTAMDLKRSQKKEAVGDEDVSSLSHRRLNTIMKDPNHPMHTHAKSELDRRKITREAKDPEEYDKEGSMMKGQLRQICSANEKLMSMVKDDDNLPEWVQSKVTKATDYIRSVRDYLESEKMEESTKVSAQNEVSSNTLSNYIRKSAADAGKPRQSARTQDKRIGGQKMADDKLRKMDGKGSAAKVAATNEVLDTPKAMQSYKDKAKYSADRAANSAAAKILRGKDKDGNRADHSAEVKTRDKRAKGLKMADRNATKKTVKALRKEESVNELSKDTMQSYWDKTKSDDAFSGTRKANNRLKGAINVTTKLDRLKKMIKK